MSQITKLFDGTALPDIETISGDSGGAASPNPATLDFEILGGTGITTVSDPITHSLSISVTGLVEGSVTTLDDTPTTCITFPLGAVPGTYMITGTITAFNVTDTAGAGYSFSGAYRTTGAAGTEITTQTGSIFEEAAMAAAGFDLQAVGNNFIVQVTGVGVGAGGKTIDWVSEFYYKFVG